MARHPFGGRRPSRWSGRNPVTRLLGNQWGVSPLELYMGGITSQREWHYYDVTGVKLGLSQDTCGRVRHRSAKSSITRN